MPRPARIEYENAFYHVMNRGRGRKTIFKEKEHYLAFLETVEEASNRFQSIVHAYCLMGNHYHLLIETPLANLGRVMRHINGVYTQRYNRLKKTDGPLFRGRYKAILVDRDAYLLQLTRYIHRNPLEMKRPLVDTLAAYPWSSYPAYINKTPAPDWLEREKTYQLLGKKQKYKGYERYVGEGVDVDIAQHYNKGNQASILGGKDFKSEIYEEILPQLKAQEKGMIIRPEITMQEITKTIAKRYRTETLALRKVVKGPTKGNEARKLAMYLSQELSGATLQDIADYFNLSHRGSVSYITHQIKNKCKNDRGCNKKVNELIAYVVKQDD